MHRSRTQVLAPVLSPEQVAKMDGVNDHPAYLVVLGEVYDGTLSRFGQNASKPQTARKF